MNNIAIKPTSTELAEVKQSISQTSNTTIQSNLTTKEWEDMNTPVKLPKNYDKKSLKDLSKQEVKDKEVFERDLTDKSITEHKALRYGMKSLNVFERTDIHKESMSMLDDLENSLK